MTRFVNRSRNKFGAKKIKNAWGEFDSKAEFYRFCELSFKQKKGEISYLKRQVRYEIIPVIKVQKVVQVQLKTKAKTKIVERVDEFPAYYTCDFQYMQDGVLVVEDVKSEATRKEKDYVLRRKLMKHLISEQNEVAGREVMRFNEWVSNEQ